jgi:hypothetical protein
VKTSKQLGKMGSNSNLLLVHANRIVCQIVTCSCVFTPNKKVPVHTFYHSVDSSKGPLAGAGPEF